MSNETFFFALLIFMLISTLIAFRLGKIWLTGLVMCEVVLMNIFVVKQFDLFGLAVTGGNVLYGGIFLATDLLNEHYGKKVAYRAITAGLAAGIFMLVTTQLTTQFIPNDFDIVQGSFLTIFSPTYRIVFASIVSYLIFQNFDIWFYDFIKKLTKGRFLWLRNNVSTVTSQVLDSIFFTAIGLLIIPALADNKFLVGFVPWEAFWDVVIFTVIVKVIVAAFDTPIVYLAKWMKRSQKSEV